MLFSFIYLLYKNINKNLKLNIQIVLNIQSNIYYNGLIILKAINELNQSDIKPFNQNEDNIMELDNQLINYVSNI